MAKNTEFDTEAYSDLVARSIVNLQERWQCNVLEVDPEELFTSHQLANALGFTATNFSFWLSFGNNGPAAVKFANKPGQEPSVYYDVADLINWAESRQESKT